MKKINEEIQFNIDSSSLILESAKKRIIDCVEKNNFGKGFKSTTERATTFFFVVETLEDYLKSKENVDLSVSDLELKIKDMDMFISGMLNNIGDPLVALELAGYIKVNYILAEIKLKNT